ncbi:hypothetical protein BJF78_33570 [Pseudonocardia sp. CNS-139]|nr:hypothetical protein BJF78_33570 [Pseudonocardia sp. CNS-139]
MGPPPELAVRAGSEGSRPSARLRPVPAFLLVGLGYLAAALALHHEVLPRLTTATTGSVTSDATSSPGGSTGSRGRCSTT